MDMNSEDLESWRIFFKTSRASIFDIINKAIMVAAKDYSFQLKLRRDQIVFLLYHHCCPCHELEPSTPLEEKNVYQSNADRICLKCSKRSDGNPSEVDGHDDRYKRVNHDDPIHSTEPDRSWPIECNAEKKIDDPTHEVYELGDETEAVCDDDRIQPHSKHECNGEKKVQCPKYDVDRNCEETKTVADVDWSQKVGHQDLIESPISGENTAIQQRSNSEKLGFNGVLSGVSNAKVDGLPEGLDKSKIDGSQCVVDGPNMNQMNEFTSGQTEVRRDSIDEGVEIVEEVSRIKKVLEDSQNQSHEILLELLMKLKKMNVNMEILKATLIGKTVTALRKHDKKEIREVARSLIRGWRAKVDEWMHVDTAVTPLAEITAPLEDEIPLEQFPTVPDELLQICEDVNQTGTSTEYFSLLPEENSDESGCSFKELGYAEGRQPPVKADPAINGKSEKVRREDSSQKLTGPLQMRATRSFQTNHQPPCGKNELERLDKYKRSRKNDMPTKLGNPFPSLRTPNLTKREQIPGEHRTISRDGESERAFMKQRANLPPNMPNVPLLKHCASEEGKRRAEGLATKRSVSSSSRHVPVAPLKYNNSAKFGQNLEKFNPSTQMLSRQQDKMKISQNDGSRKVEETRRKLKEGYEKAESAKKRRAIQILDVNVHHANRGNKRHKPSSRKKKLGWK